MGTLKCLNSVKDTNTVQWTPLSVAAATVLLCDLDMYDLWSCLSVLWRRHRVWHVVHGNKVLYAQLTAFQVNCTVYRVTSTNRTLYQYHSVPYKSHMDWPTREPLPLWWEISNKPHVMAQTINHLKQATLINDWWRIELFNKPSLQ